MTIPNYLTLVRLALAPVFIGLYVTGGTPAAVGALVVAVTFEVTDLLDGYIARSYDQVSSIGKLIDPMADSISRFSVFLAFVTENSVRDHPWPVLLAAVIFYRDAIVAYTRIFSASTGVVLAARLSGKLKAVMQGSGIIIFLTVRVVSHFYPSLVAYLPTIFYAIMCPIVLVTLWSAFDYVLSNRDAIRAMSEYKK
ncbi:MAG: CDP-alcohol phosphatidyltransferase family protein [Planctomycetota bacterium]